MKTKLKEDLLAKEYLTNGMNGAKMVRKFKPHLTKNSAKTRASKILNDVGFQRAVKDEMEAQGITSEKLSGLLDRNMSQDNNLPSSNTAIDMAFKVRGDYAPEKKLNINVSLQGKELDEAIKDKLKEIKLLTNA